MAYFEIKAEKVSMPLSALMTDTSFALLETSPIFHYENGTRTDIIEGTRYTVANPSTFDRFDVKVSKVTPVLTQEQIEKSSERVFVAFTNASCRPVKAEYGKVFLSITADDIKVVKQS